MSLRWTLSLAFAALIALALLLAGVAFILLKRGESERRTFDHLAAVAPQLLLEIRLAQRANVGPDGITDLIQRVSDERDVRVLLVDRSDNRVTVDSGGTLVGRVLQIPAGRDPTRSLYRTWAERTPDGERLVFLSVPQGQLLRLPRITADAPDQIVLAVPRATLAGAWRSLLPGLAAAGAVALGVSLVVAAVLARRIARPLALLTGASEAVARGQFDHDIPVRRTDEVGRLARAFDLMTREVGRHRMQMRRLVAGISHDLKTPLTSILGFARALEEDVIDEPAGVAEAGAIIRSEAERMRALVEDLLYLSEIEAGAVPLVTGPVDLGALVRRCVDRFAPRFAERQITIDVVLPAPLPIAGDHAKLERIVDNLLDNAAKYTPQHGRVRVSGAAHGGHVTVTVLNSGPPLSPDEVTRIFDRFYRMDQARTGGQGGSGLGLSIARELAELHGGTLAARGEDGGNSFVLRLPRSGHGIETAKSVTTRSAVPGSD